MLSASGYLLPFGEISLWDSWSLQKKTGGQWNFICGAENIEKCNLKKKSIVVYLNYALFMRDGPQSFFFFVESRQLSLPHTFCN